MIVGKKRKDVLVKELRDRKYEAFPPIKNAQTKKTPEEEEEEDEEGEESARDYDYLLSVSFFPFQPFEYLPLCRTTSNTTFLFPDADLVIDRRTS